MIPELMSELRILNSTMEPMVIVSNTTMIADRSDIHGQLNYVDSSKAPPAERLIVRKAPHQQPHMLLINL